VWHHEVGGQPTVLWSEVGEDGYERRKVEEYRDGRLGYADGETSTGWTVLGDQAVPSLDEINRDYEFNAAAVSAEEFEAIWRRARDAD
jgi:hypothetical protein